jgi:hypothetical protein
MKPVLILICMIILPLTVAGCVTIKQESLVDKGIIKRQIKMPTILSEDEFGPQPAIIEPFQLFRLTNEQIADFQMFANSPKNIELDKNRIVADYLKSHLKNFNYYSDTLIAKDSLIKQQGNCLSLAILTKAYAELNNIEIDYQLVETTPVYQKEGNLVLSSQHIRIVCSAGSWCGLSI